MSETMATGIYVLLGVMALSGALFVVLTSNVTRMAVGLAAFLIAVAGFFAIYGMPFLAVAQVFLYVGGVLILMIFAVMLVHRTEEGQPGLESRHDVGSASVAAGVFVLVVFSLLQVEPALLRTPEPGTMEALSDALLGSMLPHFEAAGVLLLIALVAVLVIVGGERE